MDALAPGSPASALVGPTIGNAIAAVMNKAEKICRVMMSTSCDFEHRKGRATGFKAKDADFTARGDTTNGQQFPDSAAVCQGLA
jgi:hypothetical protein